jgi:hypothetical protein
MTSGTPPLAGTTSSLPASPTGTKEPTTSVIRIRLDGTDVRGTLDDTPTAREFAALLPLDVTLTDFHRTERIADLPRHLTTSGAPPGTEPRAGDIAYFAPWGNLALFYRDFPYSSGLVRLGTLGADGADVLAGLAPDTRATIELTTDN